MWSHSRAMVPKISDEKNSILPDALSHSGQSCRGERNLKMRVRAPYFRAFLFLAAFTMPAFSEIAQPQDTPGQPQSSAPNTTQTTTLPPESQPQPQGSAPLRVMVGKSL